MVTNKNKIFYIHGLGGTKESRTFKHLQQKYPDIEFLEWFEYDDLNIKLKLWTKQIQRLRDILSVDNFDNITIIGNSFGGNLAIRLRTILWNINREYAQLILINPLLSFDSIISESVRKELLEHNLQQYIAGPDTSIISKLNDSLIIMGCADDVIDNITFLSKNEYIKNNNKILLDSKSNHSIDDISKYYQFMDKYITNIHL